MADNNSVWNYGALIVISLLAGYGGNELIDSSLYDDMYVCNVNDKVIYANGDPSLSSSGLTAYYLDENGDRRGRRCTGGLWESLVVRAERDGVDPSVFLNNPVSPVSPPSSDGLIRETWICSVDGCEVIT